jgi:hypothetical protein
MFNKLLLIIGCTKIRTFALKCGQLEAPIHNMDASHLSVENPTVVLDVLPPETE